MREGWLHPLGCKTKRDYHPKDLIDEPERWKENEQYATNRIWNLLCYTIYLECPHLSLPRALSSLSQSLSLSLSLSLSRLFQSPS